MSQIELDLAGLSQEELLHIKGVLSRDKKLQENSRLIKLAVNNNVGTKNKPPVTAIDLVSAEIERVERLTPKSSGSGRSTPAPSEADSIEEGFFASFADMISRKMEAIDLTGGNRNGRRSTIASFARGVMNMDVAPKTPFKYNPRETVKRRPTLLELAATRRSSSPVTTKTSKIDLNGNPAYRRGKSLPGSQTLPRTGSTGFLTTPVSVKPKYTTTNGAISDVENAGLSPNRSPKKLSTLPRSPKLLRPRSMIATSKIENYLPERSSSMSIADKKDIKSTQKTKKRVSTGIIKQRSIESQGSASQSSPEKKSSTKFTPIKKSQELTESTKIVTLPNSSPEKEFIIPEIKESPETPVEQSSDSGIYPNREYFMRRDDNESPLEDETETGTHLSYDYEPDTESVNDTDFGRYLDAGDDISVYSFSSSTQGSPIKGSVQDSMGDTDGSSGVFSIQQKKISQKSPSPQMYRKQSSPSPQRPRKMKGNKKTRHLDRPSVCIEKKMWVSPVSSPTLSHRSAPTSGASSPVIRYDVTQNPIESADTVGNLEISLIYYSADLFNRNKRARTEIPSYGTKSFEEKNCNVLSRREYVEVTGAELELDAQSKSGAPECSNGELHVTIKGAKFQDQSGKIKSPNTYVKCYLLPDKFHNSKMKSVVIKKNKEPQWNHKFILAGFSQSELRERSLEIIVGSWHFKKQEVLGGAILSIGQGGEHQPWINSSKAESYIWKTALQISGNKVKSLLPLRAHMKPTYI